MADQYLLHVTAGSDYDSSKHQTVLVNTHTPTQITNPHCTISLSVRVQNYRGLPPNSPTTSPYFSHPSHKKDQYSIELSLTPRGDNSDVSAANLLFGNDFERPVRDRLPPGFGTAFSIVKRFIDPGLEGDFYSDKPHLYGCALSSFNVLWVGDKKDEKEEEEGETAVTTDTASTIDGEEQQQAPEGAAAAAAVKDSETTMTPLEEGGSTTGLSWRHTNSIPSDSSSRKKWALSPTAQSSFQWECNREYRLDFFNPYLDFNTFSLKLPGFSISVLGFMGGEDYLRYVLREKESGEVWFVVVFSLVKREEYEEEEKTRKEKKVSDEEGEGERKPRETSEEKEGEEEVEGNRHEGEASFVPRSDDLD